jgi:pyrimidine-nucleoside phosphorylase
VAKLSGRGLGLTGGTVDKLESIPGMNMHLTREQFIDQACRIGIALSGHSQALAPAEGRFYALRDVTGTVSSIQLIASSIVSKKIAGGADSFVFDVKCGRGAFMENEDGARALAETLVRLSKTLGRRSVCLISDMEQPLGEWVGNSVEVIEAIEVMSGKGPEDTRKLSLSLAAEMILIAGVSEELDSAAGIVRRRLDDGSALAKFKEMIVAQGGVPSICEDPRSSLPVAAQTAAIKARKDGVISKMDAREIGISVRLLGGGRFKHEDTIDRAVGIRIAKKIGLWVSKGETVLEAMYNDSGKFEEAMPHLETAFEISDYAEPRRLVIGNVR